jgi:hypothetical protein
MFRPHWTIIRCYCYSCLIVLYISYFFRCAYLFIRLMLRLTLFPLSTGPFLVFKFLKLLTFCVYYQISENSIFVKIFLTIPPGCHPLVQFCSTSFVPLLSSLCVSLLFDVVILTVVYLLRNLVNVT